MSRSKKIDPQWDPIHMAMLQHNDGVSCERINAVLDFVKWATSTNCPYFPEVTSTKEFRRKFPALEVAMQVHAKLIKAFRSGTDMDTMRQMVAEGMMKIDEELSLCVVKED